MATSPNIFQIHNGSFSYGKIEVLQNLELTIQEGKFYGLIGPNGSGKSTLIDLLIATHHLQEGSITYDSRPINSYSRRELAQHLALVPQSINVGFDFTVFEIVLMGRHPHIPRFSQPTQNDIQLVNEALNLLDIEHLKDRSVINLSGGEKQRVIVARALAQNTDVLILDEATSNLDIEHSLKIMRVLKDMVENKGTTIISAIHDLNLAAAFCDELIVLKNKTIFATGSVKTILTQKLLQEVFSVKATIHKSSSLAYDYLQLEYDMFH